MNHTAKYGQTIKGSSRSTNSDCLILECNRLDTRSHLRGLSPETIVAEKSTAMCRPPANTIQFRGGIFDNLLTNLLIYTTKIIVTVFGSVGW